MLEKAETSAFLPKKKDLNLLVTECGVTPAQFFRLWSALHKQPSPTSSTLAAAVFCPVIGLLDVLKPAAVLMCSPSRSSLTVVSVP